MTNNFSREIQGLRAIAVMVVLVFHVWPDSLPGGYVGVDVFFVISGYLITGLLLREVQNTETISLAAFYVRRIRRLLPAATLVIVVTLPFVYLLPTVQWGGVAKEALASALYFQNWWLAHLAVDYLAEDSAPSLFRHYWSLSVEEQYYIIWPLIGSLLICCLPGLKRHPERVYAGMAIFIGGFSLIYSIYLTKYNPGLAYFSTGTRAWELALGSLLAVLRPHFSLCSFIRAIIGWFGLLMIIAASLNFSQSTIFPGYAALLPTLGAAFVIVAGQTSRIWACDRILSHRSMRFIGDISYSLYLWHWLVIIIFGAVLGTSGFTWYWGGLIIGTSFLLASFTKKIVEDPFRYGRMKHGKLLDQPLVIFFISIGLVVLAASPILLNFRGGDSANSLIWEVTPDQLSQRYDPLLPTIPPVTSARADNPDVYRMNCHVDQRSAEPKSCSFGPPSAERVVALIGDSHAAQWLPAFQEVFRNRPNWRIVTYTKSACAFNTVTVVIGKQRLPYESCVEWNRRVMVNLAELRPDVIVLSSSATYSVYGAVDKKESLDALTNGLISRWDELFQTGARLVVLRDTPRMQENIPECLSLAHKSVDDCATPLNEALRPDPIVMSMERMPIDKNRITYLDFTDQICEDAVCKPVKGQVLIWRDSHHMTATFSRLLSSRLEYHLVQRGIIKSND